MLTVALVYQVAVAMFAPIVVPAAGVVILIPILFAAVRFGMWAGMSVTVGLSVTTLLIMEAVGADPAGLMERNRGLPILVFLIVAAVVGRMSDLARRADRQLDQRRQVEAELLRSQAELEGLVRAREEVIESVSHQLRTPLTAVLGFADLLRGDLGRVGLSPVERQDMVELIAQEAFDLSGMIDDLLVAARLARGGLEILEIPTDLRAQVLQVLDGWNRKTFSRVVEVSGGERIQALADPARVRQILRNLVSNAFRYGGQRIAVDIGSDQSGVYIEVRDNGAALPDDVRDRIFEPYFRYHRKAGLPNTTGLGLSVSRGLAELMAGSVAYRHEAGQTIFTLRLPSAPTETDHAPLPRYSRICPRHGVLVPSWSGS